jgi:hypothetical protein
MNDSLAQVIDAHRSATRYPLCDATFYTYRAHALRFLCVSS